MTAIRLEDLGARVGETVGLSAWHALTQSDINLFGRLTRDEQWIHMDPERAAKGPFGGTIAHGFLTLALTSRLLEECLTVTGVAMAINYGLDKVRFPAPVRAGARIRGTAVLQSVSEIQGGAQAVIRLTVESEAGGKPVCVAHMVTRYVVA
jgi:acyl dehydratase